MFCQIKFKPLVIFIIISICLLLSAEIQPLVKSTFGDIQGFYMKTRGGRKISAFTRVPFALPPTGHLRFKKAVPIEPWNGTMDATKATPSCVQRNPYTRQRNIEGQEDCLYLNIYAPFTYNTEELAEPNLLPVMVFIHGGGWMCGCSSTYMYGPEFLLDADVILVTVNYRLGPLGFLSTQDEHCPGNNGLKDQQEALRFIQKTIQRFGGDKDSVTIFGESAGGASVHYHMLSETSLGLFQKAISQSGTALVPWAEAAPGEALRAAFKLAKALGCPQAPSETMLACLRSKDSYDIINTEFQFYAWDYEPMTPFKAVVEPDLPGAFLKSNPRKWTLLPTVPWLTGHNKDEGCLKTGWILSNSTRYKEFLTGFQTIAPVTFYYEHSIYTHVITEKIWNKYINSNDKQGILSGILNMYTDSYFLYPLVESVELIFAHSKQPVYLYELTYKATNSFSVIFGEPEKDCCKYTCHADDLMHLFPVHFLTKPFSYKDIEMSKLIITMWTNFAKSGNPNKPTKLPFDWKPVTDAQSMNYLDIGLNPAMKTGLASRSRFWSTLPLWHKLHDHWFHDEL